MRQVILATVLLVTASIAPAAGAGRFSGSSGSDYAPNDRVGS